MRKRKITAVVVLIALMLSIVATGALAKSNGSNVDVKINSDGSVQVAMQFKDLQQATWAMKSILKMNAENVIMGYKDGTFQPKKPVTHAEAVVMAMKAAGLQSAIDSKAAATVSLPFKDAKSIPVWAKAAVAVAVEKGYLQADASGNFQANKAASREWVVRLIAKALNLQPVNIQLPFTDTNKISADSVGYVAAVVYNQLISGFPDGSFQPNKPVTRAELAVMLGISTNELPIPGEMKFKVEGTIDSVSPQATTVTGQNYGSVADQVYSQGTITLKLEKDDDEDNGSQVTVTYPVAANALIYVDDKTVKLSDLTVGAKAEAVIKNGMVTYLEVEPVVVRGVVQAVYGTTVTILDQWGRGRDHGSLTPAAKTYNLAANVAVTLNGAAISPADLKAGDAVRMTLNGEQKISIIKAVRFKQKVEKKHEDKKQEKMDEFLEKAKEKQEKAEEIKQKKQEMEQKKEQNKNLKKEEDRDEED